MEVINFTTLVLFSSVIFLLVKAWRKPPNPNPQNLPPSPPSLPVIGHLHLLGGGAVPALARLKKKYGPIISLKLGEVTAVVISSREATKEALKIHDPACADRPDSTALEIMFYSYGDIAFCPYNEYWRQMRKICILEMLSAKNVKSYGYIRAEEIDSLVESLRLSSGEAVNITENISSLTFAVTCRASFGRVLQGHAKLIALLKELSTMAGGFEVADLFPSLKFLHPFSLNKYRLLRMRREMDAILDPAVEEHKLKKSGEFEGEDFVDVLLRMQKNKELQFPITTDNIKSVILDMFAGGIETTATTTDWAMAELMRNPRVMAKLQSEIREVLKGKTTVENRDVQGLKYLKLVVKESLRLHPPIPVLPRKCRQECRVGGFTIPNKAKVMIDVHSLGRDPQYWNDPETFLPERFENSSLDFLGSEYEFLPFGAGKRNCPGLNFGIANVEFTLAQLLYHFDWKLPQGMSLADVDMTEIEGLAVLRKNPLMVIPTPYEQPL
nr:BX5-like protein [Lamium maculatum]